MSRSVIFLAPCPICGRDCRWQQCGDEAIVKPDDFSVECPACVAA